MIDFVKLIINNNKIVVFGLFILVIFLSLLSFEKIRKALYGSLFTTLVSFVLAFVSKVEMINDAFQLLFRSLFLLFGGKNEIQSLIGIQKNMFVSIATIEYDCDVKLTNVFDFVSNINIKIQFVDFIKNIKLIFVSKIIVIETMLKDSINLSRFSFIIRI